MANPETIKGMSKVEYRRKWRSENVDKSRKHALDGYHRNAWKINRHLTIIRLRGGASVSDKTLAKYHLVREEILSDS